MSDKMKNLAVRTLSGLVLLAIVVGALFASQLSFMGLLMVIAVGCLREFYNLCRKSGISPQSEAGAIMGLIALYMSFVVFRMLDAGTEVPRTLGAMMLPAALVFLLMFPIVFLRELWRKRENPIADVSATIGGVFYVALPLSLLMFVPLLLGGGWSPAVMFGYIAVIWSNDVFAYLTGCAMGKHRLFERISPKKSWEGFFGGIAGAVVVAEVVCLLTGGDAAVWGGLAVVTAVSGVGGDLVESMFKRSVDVKDSGAIMPGHGGFLDRFDALLVSTPFAFAYLIVMALITR